MSLPGLELELEAVGLCEGVDEAVAFVCARGADLEEGRACPSTVALVMVHRGSGLCAVSVGLRARHWRLIRGHNR